MSVRALVVAPSASAAVRLADVPDPVTGPAQVLVDVTHASLNYGDLNDARSGGVPPGAVLGSDAAGVVVKAAADGTGPAVGTRVVALTSAAFAERVAIDMEAMTEVPKTLDLARRWRCPWPESPHCVRCWPPASERTRVLATRASRGVGRFAVQLAARAGAHVIASVGTAARGKGLTELGAEGILIGLDGSPQLVAAWNLLPPGGSVQSVGWTSGEPTVLPPYTTVGSAKSLTSFVIEGAAGADLATLTELAAEGDLSVQIGWRGAPESRCPSQGRSSSTNAGPQGPSSRRGRPDAAARQLMMPSRRQGADVSA